jgi:hypothetical protein
MDIVNLAAGDSCQLGPATGALTLRYEIIGRGELDVQVVDELARRQAVIDQLQFHVAALEHAENVAAEKIGDAVFCRLAERLDRRLAQLSETL